jgi:site-specific recombinase XerC
MKIDNYNNKQAIKEFVERLYDTDNFFNLFIDCTEKNYSKKKQIKSAIISFGRYLIYRKYATEEQIKAIDNHKIKRSHVLKRPTFDRKYIQGLVDNLEENQMDNFYTWINKALIMTAFESSLRRVEMSNLKFKDVNLMKREIQVIEGKGRKNRIVPITDNLLNYLQKYLILRSSIPDKEWFFCTIDGGKLTGGAIKCKLARIRKKYNIEGFSAHAMRRSFVTNCLRENRPIRHVQKICGHSNIGTTAMYETLDQQQVVDDAKKWGSRREQQNDYSSNYNL